MLFDWFGKFILFCNIPSCILLCESFEHVLQISIPFRNPSNIHFFVVVKGQIDWLKDFCVVIKNFVDAQQKNNQTQAVLVFLSETD